MTYKTSNIEYYVRGSDNSPKIILLQNQYYNVIKKTDCFAPPGDIFLSVMKYPILTTRPLDIETHDTLTFHALVF